MLRWAVLAGEVVLFLVAKFLLAPHLATAPFLTVTALAALSNIWLQLSSRGASATSVRHVGWVILLDIIFLTALLYFYGGYANPFSMVYLVYVTMAAFFLGRSWTWITLLVSFLAYVALFFWHQPIAALAGHAHHGAVQTGFDLHLHGMLLAFLLIGVLIAIFIAKMAADLEMLRAREFAADKLAALVTVVAGAAHELATPLGTIALISEDLSAQAKTGSPRSSFAADTAELSREVARAREVLARMRAHSPELHGESPVAIHLATLIERVLQRFLPAERARIQVITPPVARTITTFARALEEALVMLLKNSIEASPASAEVHLSIRESPTGVEFEVRDFGSGVAHEAIPRLGEPFYTTKAPGHGMGLGLFLVKTFASHVRGTLSFKNCEPGLQVLLVVPR